MFCKTIILSNSENVNSNAPKGILTLSKENNCIKGKIRLYNILNLPNTCKIGLYINERVHICVIIKKPHHYEFDINENIDITQSIYCALIDNSQGDKKVILEGGSFNGFYFTDSPFDAILESKDEQLEKTIDSALKHTDSCESCNHCSNCEYKNYFYENYSNNENTDCDLLNDDSPSKNPIAELEQNADNIINKCEKYQLDINEENVEQNDLTQLTNTKPSEPVLCQTEINDSIDSLAPDANIQQLGNTVENIDKANQQPDNIINKNKIDPIQKDETVNEQTEFLNDIIYQLDEMFTKYPEDDMLNSIIPDARFIRVESEKPYVLGIIYENKIMKYIAYGVPATYNSLPPADFGKHYQWLPLNPNDVMSDGYFMIYQDATNGNIVEINFEE